MTRFALLVTSPLWCDCFCIHFHERGLVLSFLLSLYVVLSILSSVCSPFSVSLYLSLVLVAGVVCFAVEGYLSIRGGVTSAGFGRGGDWASLGLFWCGVGTGLTSLYLCWGMLLSLYAGRDDLCDFRGGRV